MKKYLQYLPCSAGDLRRIPATGLLSLTDAEFAEVQQMSPLDFSQFCSSSIGSSAGKRSTTGRETLTFLSPCCAFGDSFWSSGLCNSLQEVKSY